MDIKLERQKLDLRALIEQAERRVATLGAALTEAQEAERTFKKQLEELES